MKKVEEECAELLNSIRSETESQAKDRLLSAFMKYMQSIGLISKEDALFVQSGKSKFDGTKDTRLRVGPEEKKVLSILNTAASSVYYEIRRRILDIFGDFTRERNANMLQYDFGTIFCAFEEQVEKCILVAGFVNELQHLIFRDIPCVDADMDWPKYCSEKNWASIFKNILLSGKNLVGQMTEVILPDIIRSAVSFNSEIMDAFGFISQIRGSVDTALEQLIEVEIERASLVELEQSYFDKVGHITEQQLALEEAALKGRDHLSWEEADELASQEEACRAQLDQLHSTWNHRDMRTSSLIRRESDIKNALVSSERHFQSLLSVEENKEPHVSRSKALLATLLKPFSELESIDRVSSSFIGSVTSHSNEIPNVADWMNSGYPISEYIWKFGGLLNSHCFFIWKIGVVDSFLDSCIHDVASSVEQNLGFDQLYTVVKKKLEIQLQKHIGQYLRERLAPTLLAWLDKENEHLKQLTEATNELGFDLTKKDAGAVKRVQLMLEEYCNAHETARAAKSAVSLLKRQMNELKDALHKTSLEIVQMEWMHDVALAPSHNSRLTIQKYLTSDDNLYPIIVNLSRPKLLDSIQSSVSKIARSLEILQACERTSLAAEGQLERAMGWACGGPNTSATGSVSAKGSGIPPEFHDHLMRRRQLLWEAKEKASNIIKICISTLAFEVSRDGIFQVPGEIYPFRTSGDGRTWQQAYLNALTRLDATYHSFTRTEQEWKLAQSKLESANNGLYSATNELYKASLKAKSASGDLQNIVLAMRDCAYEASVALSSFSRVSGGHTALTSECGSMLEEVLAITEDLDDVHSLGKEASVVHHSLMEDLSKVNAILLPLESVLSKDVAAMTDAIARERETKNEISPIHGQAIYQSYCLRIREAYQTFKPLVPSLAVSVKELYSMLTRLARTASLHAGNLHKALEGLGESQEVKSQEITLSRPDIVGDAEHDENEKEREGLSRSNSGSPEGTLFVTDFPLQDKGWISPPESIYSSSSESGIEYAEASLPDSFNDPAEVMEQLLQGSDSREATNYSVPSSQSDHQEGLSCQQSESKITEFNQSDAGAPNEPNEYVRDDVASQTEKSVDVPVDNLHLSNKEKSQVKSGGKSEICSSDKVQNEDENLEASASLPTGNTGSRVARGKNAYAMSVLRRVEMKLDGRDIADNREVSISDQVDYLLKQAISVDNLCNMYEGWTPWI